MRLIVVFLVMIAGFTSVVMANDDAKIEGKEATKRLGPAPPVSEIDLSKAKSAMPLSDDKCVRDLNGSQQSNKCKNRTTEE